MRQQQAAPPAVPRGRPWLAAAGAALVVAALGTAGLARRYVAAESAQAATQRLATTRAAPIPPTALARFLSYGGRSPPP